MADSEPRAMVEAPVRAALGRLVVGGTGVFLAAVALGLACTVGGMSEAWHLATHVGAAAAMLAFLVTTQVARHVRGRPPELLRGEAWSRAYDVDRADAQLAAVVVAGVPAGVFAMLAVMAWPHLLDRATRAEEYGLWLPILAILWVFSTVRWVDVCRDHLARSVEASERRWRAYWSAPHPM
jgi:hypothetical protein